MIPIVPQSRDFVGWHIASDMSCMAAKGASGLHVRVSQCCKLWQVGSQLRQAVSSLESAKADNLALVERLRYVQGYRSQTRGKGKIMSSHSCAKS